MNGTLQALGWTLIHFCWQATILAAIYLAVDLWLKNTRSQTRYLLTLATLSSMFLAFMGTLGYEALHSSIGSPLQFSNAPIHTVVTLPVKAFTTRVGLLANGPVALHWTTLLSLLDGMWMLGVVGLSIRSLGGWLWLERLRRTTMEETPEAIQASFQKVCVKLRIARLPELRLSEIIPGPMTIGILRTLVLLPASALLALSPEQLEAIFAHELAHVRRADYFWNLVQTLAETLFFFHPAVWWIGKRLREQRELCCDDIVIATCPDPLVYATALFRLEDQRAAGLNFAMALDGHQSRTKFRARILRILGEACPESHRLGLRPLSLIVVCAGLFLFLSPLPKVLGALPSHHPLKHQMLPLEGIPTGEEQATKPPTLPRKKLEPTLHKIAEVQEPRAEATPDSGRPSVNDLMNMKAERIVYTKLRAAGVEPRSVDEFASDGLSDIIPEFINGMKTPQHSDDNPVPVADSYNVPPHAIQKLVAHVPSPHLKRNAEVSSASYLLPTKITEEQGSNADEPSVHIGAVNLEAAPPAHIRRWSSPGQPRLSEPSGQPRLSEPSGQPRRSDSSPPLIQ